MDVKIGQRNSGNVNDGLKIKRRDILFEKPVLTGQRCTKTNIQNIQTNFPDIQGTNRTFLNKRSCLNSKENISIDMPEVELCRLKSKTQFLTQAHRKSERLN